MMNYLRIGLEEPIFHRQKLSAKIIAARTLRRLNFGRFDHKRKEWWTLKSLEHDHYERNWKKYYDECEVIESQKWRDDLQNLVDNYFAWYSKESSTFDDENENSTTPKSSRYWLIFIIRIVLSLGIFLSLPFNYQFGKEYSSDNAGDGPPMNSNFPEIDTNTSPTDAGDGQPMNNNLRETNTSNPPPVAVDRPLMNSNLPEIDTSLSSPNVEDRGRTRSISWSPGSALDHQVTKTNLLPFYLLLNLNEVFDFLHKFHTIFCYFSGKD